MKDIKAVLLYLDSFDEKNMFDFEHNNKLYYVSEVLRFKMYDRIEKYDLNYCEDVILDLIDLTVKITDMINLKKPNVLMFYKKSKNCIMMYHNMKMMMIQRTNPLNMMIIMSYQKIVILVKL